MKRNLIAAILALTMGAHAIAPPKAQATIGVATGMMPLVVTGGLVAIAGGTLMAISAAFNDDEETWAWLFFGGFFATVVGVIILDEKDRVAAPVFRELTEEQAQQVGLTLPELAAYRAELDEANAEAQVIAIRLASTKDASYEDARKLWEGAAPYFSPEAMGALKKVSIHFHSQLAHQ